MIFKNKSGFTITELMVVVSILSILITIGVVSWNSHVRQAKATEAKINLAMVYAKQEKYKMTCNTYFPDLLAIGARPEGELHYNIGGKYDPADFINNNCSILRNCNVANDPCQCSNFFSHICSTSREQFKVDLAATGDIQIGNGCLTASRDSGHFANLTCFFNKKINNPSSPSFVDLDTYIGGLTSDEESKIYGSLSPPSLRSTEIKPDRYLIFAVGDLRSKQQRAGYDVWVINQKGIPQNIQNGR